jgi:glycosyltransferase involved in cell wall biosynthesis
MKILLVITKSEIGGAQVFVLNLANSLKNLGNDVEVVAGDGNYLFEELEKKGIKYHYLNSLKRNFNIPKALYFIYDLYRLLKKNSYDIVHLNSTNTLIGSISIKLLANRPRTVFTFHGLSILDKNYHVNSLLKQITKLYYKTLLKLIDGSVFVSQYNYDEMKEEGIIKNAKVIINGLDYDDMKFYKSSDARNYFSDRTGFNLNESYLIGSTGRLSYQKNYEFLVDNFKLIKEKISNAKIIIIGDGPDREKLNELITKKNIAGDFILVGAIKDSYRYIKAFDLFVLPSRYEGLSISLIEAIFAEIPILATDVGGNFEIVGAGSDQLFSLNDSEDFLYKMMKIRNDSGFYIKSNCKTREQLSLNKMTESYYNFYKTLIES